MKIKSRPQLVILSVGFMVFSTNIFGQADGKSIFLDKCSICHGADGQGKTAKGRKLKVKSIKETILKQDEAAMTKIVVEGKGSDMDSYKNELKPDEIKAVVEYYRSLAK